MNFCPQHGTKLETMVLKKCSCGNEMMPNQNYCSQCGQKLQK
ncbi:MAG: hypothetical protein AAB358_00155 [Patescibacteria group bacterium]